MSVLKVAAIQNPSAATAAITLDANGGALIGGQAAYARNLVYNGAMQVAQRSASVTSITTAGYYTADRFGTQISALGTWTQSVEDDAPSGSGLRKSLKILCTTADAAPAASDFLYFDHRLEGQDLQRISKGTAEAKQLTLSFWVKSNVTGTYIAALRDTDNSRVVSASYAVSASATWEEKVITFPADITGVFNNDNELSLAVNWWLGVGSNYTSGTLDTSWGAASNANRAVGQTNLAAATDNYWQVTGVQLEVGPVATPFEFKSFGQELRECQRYYQKVGTSANNQGMFSGMCNSTTEGYFTFSFRTTMRTPPTALETTGTAANYEIFRKAGGSTSCNTVPSFTTASEDTAFFLFPVASGLTAGEAVIARMDAGGYLAWSAEL
jgi:hypothetical protein